MLACPGCGSRRGRILRPRNWPQRVLAWIGFDRVRCGACGEQRTQSLWLFDEILYARCPGCFRLELTSWSERRVQATFWQRIKITCGGKRVRCARCRINFVSFREVQNDSRNGADPLAGG